jgi:nitrite reductase/ring-hydroxylating ferredoxin subunit
MRFFPLEKLVNLHDGYQRQFKIDSLQLLLTQQEGELFLLEAKCPHRAHPLDVAQISGGTITCVLHRYRFSLLDGRVLRAGEERCRALRVFSIEYQGNEIGVML